MFFLANNHITDYQQPLIKTLQELSRNKIKTCGAGTSLNKAKKPIEYVINDQKIAIFGFGWHITDCILAKQNKPGVNPFTYENLFNVYKNYRKNNKQAIILYLFNWNYEMELFPQPAHRKISKELIDIGVDGIIGFHPHIVQGIEVYKNKPIVYGMGNWYLPQEKYQGIKVKFPEISNLELSLDLIYDNGEFKDIDLHWYIFDPKKNKIYYKFSEKYTDSEKIDKLTPFQGMKHKDYKKWFKLNRRKKKFLPIYYEMNSIINNLKDIWVQLRKMIINKLVKLKIHKGSH